MTTHLGLQRILVPSAQVSSLTTGSITLPSAKGVFVDFSSLAAVYMSATGTGTNFQVFNVGNETITAYPSALVTASGSGGGGMSNNTVAGYVQEGFGEGGDFSKISFVTRVASFLTGGVKDGGTGVNNDGTAGYTGGGTGGGPYLNNITKMAYPTDVYTTTNDTIYDTVIQNYGWSTGASFGYFGGGFTQGSVTTGSVTKYTYSNETSSGTSGINSLRLGAAASSASKGYIFGGYNNSSSNVNGIQSWTYSNDTQANLGATLSAARRENVAGGTYSFLYSFGGTETSAVLSIQKFTTSNESISTLGTSLTYGVNGGQNHACNNRGA
jgi:hypothetical protein